MEKEYLTIPTICPVCGAPLEIRQDGIAEILYCTNPNCEGKFLNQLEHFCSKRGMDIKGLSKATLNKLIDWGWVEKYTDIYNLYMHEAEWAKKTGFGPASVNRILDAIEESRNAELYKVIAAAGIPEIGISAAKVLANYYKTWKDFRFAIDNEEDFSHLPDFGSIMNDNIHKYNFEIMDDVAGYINFKTEEKETEQPLTGKQFCITGKVHKWKNRDELKKYIEDHGGKVTGSVTSKTTYLINNDVNSNSSKNQQAKKLGIPILSEENFVALISDLLAF